MTTEVANKKRDLFESPLYLIRELKRCIREEEGNISSLSSIKYIRNKMHKGMFYLYFQVKKSRVIVNYSIQQALNDHQIIYSCDPLSLINIGYLSKKQQDYNLLEFINKKNNNSKEKTMLYNITNFTKRLYSKVNNIKKKELIDKPTFSYSISHVNKDNSTIKIKIIGTQKEFDIPLADLLHDSLILYNTNPDDLVSLGYMCNEYGLNDVLGVLR